MALCFLYRRREFITLLGGTAAAWPLAARAQRAAMPVVGFLASQLPDAITDRLRGFRQGLKDTGYVEGENVAIVYRFAENQEDRLPTLAAELVSRHVAMIATAGLPPTFAAKAATTTIPIVFLRPSRPKPRPALFRSSSAREQLQQAGRKHHRLQQHELGAGGQAVRTPARAAAPGGALCRADRSKSAGVLAGVAITFTRRRTRSAANSGSRSIWLFAQRNSMVRLRPST
jgi:ABC transporter substrate binding protein